MTRSMKPQSWSAAWTPTPCGLGTRSQPAASSVPLFFLLLLLLTVASFVDPGLALQQPPSMAMAARLPPPRASPMPPMLVSNVPGTWAHDTMSRRVREEILQRLLEDNQVRVAERGWGGGGVRWVMCR